MLLYHLMRASGLRCSVVRNVVEVGFRLKCNLICLYICLSNVMHKERRKKKEGLLFKYNSIFGIIELREKKN